MQSNRMETEMRLAIENGRAEDIRWHVRKTGEQFWASGLMMPIRSEADARDDLRGFVKIFRDRTAEREIDIRHRPA